MAVTLRSPISSRIGGSWCGASMRTHSVSSPTSQTLLSTSQLPPSRLNVPEVVVCSIRALMTARSFEDDHRTEHVAVVHLGERRLHVVEADGLGDELVQRQPALQVQ